MNKIENEANDPGVAPKVTIADIEANIVSEHYFTASQGCIGNPEEDAEHSALDRMDLLTFCVLILKNGFTVHGFSACASAANFDPIKGRMYAREDAVNKVWGFMGYELRTKLAATENQVQA
jgi:Phage protein (N4 Gp49/phage Sf6 gene 66) family